MSGRSANRAATWGGAWIVVTRSRSSRSSVRGGSNDSCSTAVAPAARLEPNPITRPAVQNSGNALQTRSGGLVSINSASRCDWMQKARCRCTTALGRSVDPEV